MGAKIIMIKLNSNIINISLLKCCVDELNNRFPEETRVIDITETIQEVIESLQNKG